MLVSTPSPCERVKYILEELSKNPTPENVEKLTAEIGLAELNDIADHVEECTVCEKAFSDSFSSDAPEDEKDGNLAIAFLMLFAGIDGESAQEKATREAMLAKLDEAERELEEAVRKFVEDRSAQLEPELFYGIPMKKYRYAVFFLAADAMGMLLARTARNKFNDPNTCFELAEDGAVFHEKVVCFTGEQVQHEIARMIRSAQSESDELDLDTAAKLVRWIFNALAYGNWNIISGYAGSMPEELHKLAVISLAPNQKRGLENDPLEGWR